MWSPFAQISPAQTYTAPEFGSPAGIEPPPSAAKNAYE